MGNNVFLQIILLGFQMLLFVIPSHLKAQATIAVQQVNIQTGTTYATTNISTTTSSDCMALSLHINMNTSTASFTGTSGSFPTSSVLFQLNSINGKPLTGLGTVPAPFGLSTSNTRIFTGSKGELENGVVTANYSIATAGKAWIAGSYMTNLLFKGACIGTPKALTVVIPAFISATPPTNAQIKINNFNYFRTVTASTSQSMPVKTTVQSGLGMRTSASQFVYTLGYTGGTDPATSVNKLSTQLSIYPPIHPSIAFQILSPAGGIAVPIGNTLPNNIIHSVSPKDLLSGFLHQGTYTTTLTYQAFDARTSPTVSTVSASPTLSVVVDDMAELVVNNRDVTLSFASVNDLKNGISTTMTNHIRLSKTSPYVLTVKASSAYLVNGTHQIPVGVIRIDTSTETGGKSISLSTSGQTILNGTSPVLDRLVTIKYSLPASEVSAHILGQTPGNYATTLIYTLVAP